MKAIKKVDPKAEVKAEAPPPKPKKKALIVIIAASLLLSASIAGGWFFFMRDTGQKAEVKREVAKPPVFVPLESFTVNLQTEEDDQYLQIAMTVQVADAAQVDVIKLNMPQIRSRLLLLLSSKKASEIASTEGKKTLTKEIIEQIKLPFSEKGTPQNVSGVFFTSFIIQ
ncbi:MAG: flagellar basal body-associated protein FliL [Pseudomonadota bacterium]